MAGGQLKSEKRQMCLLTRRDTLEHLYSLKHFPVFIGATTAPEEQDLFFDMKWDICKETGFIQLQDLLSPDLIYSGFHSEAVGGVWQEHHSEFCKFASSRVGKRVLEIGGSNGKIAKQILEMAPSVEKYVIVEPNPKCASKGKLSVVNAFFSKELVPQLVGNFDTVIHSHTFEHVYDPFDFLEAVEAVTEDDAAQIFSIPNLEHYLSNKFTNTLNFEHTMFLNEPVVNALLRQFSFQTDDTIYFKSHSIFYGCRKSKKPMLADFVNEYEKNKRLFREFISHHATEVDTLNAKIEKHQGAVYMFGGHIFSQFLLNTGLNNDRIACILDNSTEKENKRLYGTSKMIRLPEFIKDQKDIAIIIKAGQYQSEVVQQFTELNPGAAIWE